MGVEVVIRTFSVSGVGIDVVVVGHKKGSQGYVNMKRKECAKVGIKSFDRDLRKQVAKAELMAKVQELNADPDVHGQLIINRIMYMSHIYCVNDKCIHYLIYICRKVCLSFIKQE